MKDKIAILILCAIGALMPAVAQRRTISARIVSSEDSIPVQFSTIRLMQPDSVTVATSLTDKNGRFTYYLSIHYTLNTAKGKYNDKTPRLDEIDRP